MCLIDSQRVEIHAGRDTRYGVQISSASPQQWYINENYTKSRDSNDTDFNWRNTNDIGLIKLTKGFTRLLNLNIYVINTICLPNANQYNTEAENVTFFGYGVVNSATNTAADHLQKGEGVLRPNQQCTERRMLCGGYVPLSPRMCSVRNFS